MQDIATNQPVSIPEEKKQKFQELTGVPDMAWKTIILGIFTALGVLLTYVGYFTGYIPLLAGTALVTTFYYFTFSPIHDAIHRALSKDHKTNDLIGGINVFLVSPYAGIKPGLKFFRWYHMEHHRFTNEEKDPDNYVHGSWLTIAFRWMTIDYHYLYRALTTQHPFAIKTVKEMIPFMIATAVVILTLIYFGYGWEVLFLWYIPGRLTFLFLGFVFFWLPHAHSGKTEHNVKQKDNLTLATTVRNGWEFIMSPILQYQNYHLIHHLWPTTPCYNNYKVWKLLEPELTQRDLAVQHNFNIMPEIIIKQQS